MLELRDFFHLPQIDHLIEELVTGRPGLLVVAGLDSRPMTGLQASAGFLPSGRTTIFRVLVDAILAKSGPASCLVVSEDRSVVRVPREFRRKVHFMLVEPPFTYSGRIAEAARRRPGLLVIDQLTTQTVPAALEAGQQGVRVLSQLDTVFRGASAARHLLHLGASQEQLAGLAAILAIQRMPALCPRCKRLNPPDPAVLARLEGQIFNQSGQPLPFLVEPASVPTSAKSEGGTANYSRADGCEHCRYTGRYGDVAVFDIFRAEPGRPDLLNQPSLISMEAYGLHLASLGLLPLEDFLDFESDQFQRTFNLLVSREADLKEANTALEVKLAELEAANRVLQQRTEALITFQTLGQALIGSTDLDDLAARVCRSAGELCGAERAILYYLRPDDQVEALALHGWTADRVPRLLPAAQVFDERAGDKLVQYHRWPPGIPPRNPDVEGANLRAGLYVPLIAQGKRVGLMIIHSVRKNSFAPGEAALLQTFANQASLAIQRAGLIEQLRDKIAQLEAAQAELVKKERMEHELELARQVQRSVVPVTYPEVQGYQFAARYEPARQVGGDFYDVIALDPNHFGVAIADVSDKGMPAALYMALTRSLLRAEAHRERSPRAVLYNVNQLLQELGELKMFVTLFYGVIERASRRLAYARAGHDRPVLLRDGKTLELGGQGHPLGVFGQGLFQVSEEHLQLNPGDRLVLYTDGLTDVMDASGQRYDREQLLALLGAQAGLPPSRLCEAVFASLADFKGAAEQYDDMAALIVEVEG